MTSGDSLDDFSAEADVTRPLRLSDLNGRPMLDVQAEQKCLVREEQRGRTFTSPHGDSRSRTSSVTFLE